MSTSDVGVTSTDRFSFSLFLALMLHAALILGIGFSSELNTTQNVSIDITLSVANDLVEPDQANFIATTNQLGSGQESDVHEMTTRQHADFHNNAMAEVASQPSPLPEVSEASVDLLTAQAVAEEAVSDQHQEFRERCRSRNNRFDREKLVQEIASLEAHRQRPAGVSQNAAHQAAQQHDNPIRGRSGLSKYVARQMRKNRP